MPCSGLGLEAVSCCLDLPVLCLLSRVRPGAILYPIPHRYQHFFSQDASHICPGWYVGSGGSGKESRDRNELLWRGEVSVVENRVSSQHQWVSLALGRAEVRGKASWMPEKVCLEGVRIEHAKQKRQVENF